MKRREINKKKILDKRWKAQEKLGLTRPTNAEENARRAREAHIPEEVDGKRTRN